LSRGKPVPGGRRERGGTGEAVEGTGRQQSTLQHSGKRRNKTQNPQLSPRSGRLAPTPTREAPVGPGRTIGAPPEPPVPFCEGQGSPEQPSPPLPLGAGTGARSEPQHGRYRHAHVRDTRDPPPAGLPLPESLWPSDPEDAGTLLSASGQRKTAAGSTHSLTELPNPKS